MARVPLLTTRDELAPAQQDVFDAVAASRGAVRGLFAVLLHCPDVAAGAQVIGAYLRYHSTFEAQVRESLILAVAKLLDCDYEATIHRPEAIKAGVDATTLAHIEAGRFDQLEGDVGLAVAFARALAEDHRVPDALFERATTTRSWRRCSTRSR